MPKIPRPYQYKLKADIYDQWRAGNRNVIAILPTGGGKSVLVGDISLDGAHENMAQAIVAHRNELVGQMSMHIAEQGIPHRLIAADDTIARITREHRDAFGGRSFINPGARTGVIGVDTLIARKDTLTQWCNQISRWTIDEAHHVLRENKWGKAVKMFPNAWGLGVTATGGRPDGMGLGREFDGVFDCMVFGPDMRTLIDMGNLCDYEIVCPESDLDIDESDIGPSGDISQKKLKAKADKSKIVGCVVKSYLKYCNGKQAIVFATDTENGAKMANDLNDAGVRAAFVCAKTPTAVRDQCVREFKSGRLLVLVNVDLFDEGFDCPACEVVMMARPTASIVKYLQMVGRALRTKDGKRYGLIIDMVSNFKRHHYPDKQRLWNLARRDKRGKQEKCPDDLPLTNCKNYDLPCGKPYEAYLTNCPHCGEAPPLPATRVRTIQQVDGDFVLLDVETLRMMREASALESPADVGARVMKGPGGRNAANMHMHKQLEKIVAQQKLIDVINQWAGIEFANGFTEREIHKRFYLTLGVDVLTALAKSNTTADFEATAQRIQGWYQ